MAKLQMLFEPITVGPLQLKNRMVLSPMANRLSTISGEVTNQTISHYRARAKGGVSMVTVEATAIDSRHIWPHPQLAIWDDNFIPGLRRLAEAIHVNGALACIQLHHSGMWGADPVSPSGVPCEEMGYRLIQPRVMGIEEIEEIPRLFGESALRAMSVGFDAIDIHGGTSYLLQQFVSPHTNLRTDKYGGTKERRWQLVLEIINAIQEMCGRDFPIGYTMVLDELLPDGILFETEAKPFAQWLEKKGVAYLHVQIGTYETFAAGEGITALRSPSPGAIVNYVAELKKSANIPIFTTFLNTADPVILEEVLQKGQADVILLGRGLIADPDLPKKAQKGRTEDIRLCIRCAHCYECWEKGWQLTCSINIEAGGREVEYAIHPASSPKNVLVVGSGPAGLEAARVAALRGHNVTLMEKETELGGNLNVASLPAGKGLLKTDLISWLEKQCVNNGVKIELDSEANPEVIENMGTDVVIVATGSTPLIPTLPGATGKNVVTAADVLSRAVSVGRTVVVAGGGQVGVEVADYLAEKNSAEKITIIEMLPELATDMEGVNRAYLLQKLYQHRIKIVTDMQIEEILKTGIVGIKKDGARQSIEADTVVLAMGYIPRNRLAEELRGKITELYLIGDCAKPRRIMDAMHEGSYVGRII